MEIVRQSLLICVIWCLWDQVYSIPSPIKTGSSSFKSSIPVSPLKDSSSKCGQAKRGQVNGLSIVNGKDAMLGSWPWMVGLMEGSPKYPINSFFCGGSLISKQWVITAARCVADKSNTNMFVRLGELDFDDQVKDGATPIDAPIETITVHHMYLENKSVHDIALIKLKSPVHFTENIHTICLPDGPEYGSEEYYRNKQSFVITGWGLSKPRGEFPSRLQEASVNVITEEDCKKDSILATSFMIDSYVICAGGSDNSSCNRDSGGPLMFINWDDGCYYLGGITSGGDSVNCNERPTVYTKVARYIPWINKITGENFSRIGH